MDAPLDPTKAGERAGEVVDLFSKSTEGRSRGVHHLLGKLAKNDRGGYLGHLANVLLILAHDPPVVGMLGYNDFTSEYVMMRAPPPAEDGEALLSGPYPRPWGVEDLALVQAYLQRLWSSKINLQTVEQAMLVVARQGAFHPIRDWLGGLKWDQRPRLDAWLINTFDCKDTVLHRSIGAKFMIAAVRRIRQPGCKFDQLLVLEGPQGIGKSTALEALFGRHWFSDAMPDDLANKDAAMALLGVWGLELGEIEQLIRAEVETVKAFLSRAVDRFRPPYGKHYVERPRQGVLIGTTNARDYLRDSTGNRRIWPVWCNVADAKFLQVNRDQLWAEAASREASGEHIWLEDTHEIHSASVAQNTRLSEDAWTEPVRRFLVGKIDITIADLLKDGLNIPTAQQGRKELLRCAAILRVEGWDRTHIWVKDKAYPKGKTAVVWRPLVTENGELPV